MKASFIFAVIATFGMTRAVAPVATFDSFQELTDAIFDYPEALTYYSEDSKQWFLYIVEVTEKDISDNNLVDTDVAIAAAKLAGFSCGTISEKTTFSPDTQTTLAEVLVKRANCDTLSCLNAQICWRNGCKQCMGGRNKCFGKL